MNNISKTKTTSTKKTALDQFELFYEEIPLQAAEASKNAVRSRSDRLMRRSKAKN